MTVGYYFLYYMLLYTIDLTIYIYIYMGGDCYLSCLIINTHFIVKNVLSEVKNIQLSFIVCLDCNTVLGLKTCTALKLVKGINTVTVDNSYENKPTLSESVQSNKTNNSIIKEFQDIFEGLGCQSNMSCSS